MKRCPVCNREYVDDTLRFCLEDGTPLAGPGRRDEAPKTQVLPQRQSTDPNASVPTIPSYSLGNPVRPVQTEPRKSNALLIAGIIVGALLLLAVVGVGGFFAYQQFEANEGEESNTNQSGSVRTKSPGSNEPGTNVTPKPSPVPTGPQINTPLTITASASSVRLAVQSNTYYAANAIDGKRSTAWIEGSEGGPGLGEWIQFDFDREINLHRILFQPGYFKSPQIWAQNNRLASVTAQFSDGSSRELTFSNRMESQKIDIGSVRTKWVRFVIKSVYYGTDPDTALSELAFEWD